MGQNASRSSDARAPCSSVEATVAEGHDQPDRSSSPPNSKKRRHKLSLRSGRSLQQRKRGSGQRGGSGRSGAARRNSRRRREMTALVRSWHVVADDLEALGTQLFDKLTRGDTCPDLLRTIVGLPEHAPVTRLQLLSHPRSRQHARRVMETVGMVVDSYSEFDRVRPLLVMLGRHHAKYGVNQRQLMVVGQSFLSLMREKLGDAWGPNLQEAWSSLFALIYEALVVGIEQRRSVGSIALTSELARAEHSLSPLNRSRPKTTRKIIAKQSVAKKTGPQTRVLTRTDKHEFKLSIV